jgi:hypothetical protein
MIECLSFFRYIVLFIIYIMAFVSMMNSNLELVGIGFMFIVNLITSFFIFVDFLGISETSKKYDIFVGVLIVGMALHLISSILIVIALSKLHKKAKQNGLPMQLSPSTRRQLENFKIVFFTNAMSILTMTMLFFLGKPGVSFYNYAFDQSTAIRELFFFIVKILLTFGTLGMSTYLVYISHFMTSLVNRQID